MTDAAKAADILGRSLGSFLDELAAGAAAPGGGSAAAVTVAMAAGLTASVARASASGWEEAGGAIAQAEELRRRVAPLVEVDASAYDEALSTLGHRGQIAAPERDAKLEEALARAAAVPLEIAEVAANVAELAALVARSGEPAVRADASVAAILAEAAASTAARLVEVNLGTIEGDTRLDRARELVAQAAGARERAALAGWT